VVLAQASSGALGFLEPRDLLSPDSGLRRRRPRAGIPGLFGFDPDGMTMRMEPSALAAASSLLALLAGHPGGGRAIRPQRGRGLTFCIGVLAHRAAFKSKLGFHFDDAAESMRLRANQRNLKYISVNQLARRSRLSAQAWPTASLQLCDGRWLRRK